MEANIRRLRPGRTVLHDVSDDSKLVKVTSAALSAERLLERDLNVVDQVLVK